MMVNNALSCGMGDGVQGRVRALNAICLRVQERRREGFDREPKNGQNGTLAKRGP